MNYNREEDILYLAHQLWEESDEPATTPQTYWKRAALQVLAQDRRHPPKADVIAECGQDKTSPRLDKGYVQFGPAVCINMGTAAENRRVTFIKRYCSSKVANPAPNLIRRVD